MANRRCGLYPCSVLDHSTEKQRTPQKEKTSMHWTEEFTICDLWGSSGSVALMKAWLNKPTHRLVVASNHKVLILPPPHRALVQWMHHPHVRLLLEPQQTTVMELHTVTAIGADTDYSPDNKGDLQWKYSAFLVYAMLSGHWKS